SRHPVPRSPAGDERRVGLVTDHMFLDLVQFQADQVPIRDIALQPPVIKGGGQFSLHLLHKDFSRRFLQNQPLHLLVKVIGSNLFSAQNGKDVPVHDYRLEDVRYVKIEGEAAKIGRVQKTDPGIQMRLVDLGQGNRVQKGIAQADQQIEPILGRSARSSPEPEVLVPNAFGGSLLGNLSDGRIYRQQ